MKDIPVFMTNLSIATENNGEEITQSPATVQSIVGILLKVSDVSKNVFINQPVMKVCTLQCVSVCTKDISQTVANQNFIKYLYVILVFPSDETVSA